MFKSSIEMNVTLNAGCYADSVADFIEDKYKVKVVEIFSYGDNKRWSFKIEGNMSRILKLTKDCVSGKFEDKYDLY